MFSFRKTLSIILTTLMIAILIIPTVVAEDRIIEEPIIKAEYVENTVIVKYESTIPEWAKANYKAIANVTSSRRLGINNMEVLKFKGKTVEEVIEKLEGRPGIAWVEPDYKIYPTIIPNDTFWEELWGMHGSNGVDADNAWDIQKGDAQVRVAVIDTGIYTGVFEDEVIEHPDMINTFDNGWDFFNDDSTVYDGYWDYHGTHVSGTIAANLNDIGVVGVAPNVTIIPIKFLGQDGGSTSDAIDAIMYAIDMEADIINASWGSYGESDGLEEAIALFNKPFVAAAGNDRYNTDNIPHYPSAYGLSNIISVAATDSRGRLARFSNFGVNSVDIAAPGVEILSTMPMVDYNVVEPEIGYYWLDGTSMAAPHVTGVLALMLSQNPNLSTDDLIMKLYESAEPNSRLDGRIKYPKIVNAYNAVIAVTPTEDTSAPLIQSSTPAHEARDVDVNTDVEFRFDEEIIFNVIDVDSNVLVKVNGVAYTDATLSTDNKTINMNLGTLLDETEYRIDFLEGAILDAAGNSEAQFITFDTFTPPKLVASTPDDGTVDVAVDTVVLATFDKAFTFNSSLVKVNGVVYEGATQSGLNVNLNLGELQDSTVYTIEFLEGAVVDNSSMYSSFWFETVIVDPPVTDNINMVSTDPSDSQRNVPRSSDIIIEFDSDIVDFTIHPELISITGISDMVIEFEGTHSLRINPNGSLPKLTWVTVEFAEGALTNGEISSSSFNFTFRTKNK